MAFKKAQNRVVIVALALLAISSGHLIEDYLYGVPAGFGLSEPVGLLLAVIWYGLLGSLLVLAVRGARAGFIGLLVIGIFLALAEILYYYHDILYTWPYRNGLLSKGAEIVVIGLSVALAVLCGLALRARSSI